MADVVKDYTALISGKSRSGNADRIPRIVTYSYLNVVPAYQYEEEFPVSFLISSRPFSQNDRTIMENAISQVSANAGLLFIEVDSGEGDINIAKYNFNLESAHQTSSGFAYYPSVWASDMSSRYSDIGGEISVNNNKTLSNHLVLHELGHALGLKHPFESDPILPANLDNKTKTVIYYSGQSTGIIGPFDIDALQFLYGGATPAPGTLESWSFDNTLGILTQDWGDEANTIHGVRGDDVISAGGGDDVLAGHFGNGILMGGAGNDTLLGGDGDDLLFGGPGDDTLSGEFGADILVGGPGADDFQGWDGINTASYRDAATGVTADLNWNGTKTGDALGDTYNGIYQLEGSEHADRRP